MSPARLPLRESRLWIPLCAAILVSLIAPMEALALESDTVAVDPAAVPVGGVIVVRVRLPDPSGTFEGKRLRFFRAGEISVALVGIDLDHPPGRFPMRISAHRGDGVEKIVEVVARKFPEERLTVPRGYTELDAKTLRRVSRERKTLEDLWSRTDSPRAWEGRFLAPAIGEASRGAPPSSGRRTPLPSRPWRRPRRRPAATL